MSLAFSTSQERNQFCQVLMLEQLTPEAGRFVGGPPGLKITDGQRTMTGQKRLLTSDFLTSPVTFAQRKHCCSITKRKYTQVTLKMFWFYFSISL